MVSKVKKIVGGVVIVFVVLALIGACLGEDEGDSEYLAWLEKKCPNCIFRKLNALRVELWIEMMMKFVWLVV